MKFPIARDIFLILIGLTLFYAYIALLDFTLDDKVTSTTLIEAFIEWQKCMAEQVDNARNNPERLWDTFAIIIRHCTSTTGVARIKLTALENDDEVKHFILGEKTAQPSVIVTLGVGADIRAEETLQQLLPKGTEFYGVDPVKVPNAELFSKVGTYFPIAVSAHSGRADANIRLSDGSYVPMNVMHVDVMTLFTKMLNHTYIDHLILDNEGPEYDIVPMIAIDNLFADNNVVICHMNVEFHVPRSKELYEKFASIMWRMLIAGRFAVIHNANLVHQRMFIVNYYDPYCTEKYLEQFFEL